MTESPRHENYARAHFEAKYDPRVIDIVEGGVTPRAHIFTCS
nr:hypothetical protein [Candidatus Sigynarchaeum springense]